MARFDRQVATALRLIQKNGQQVTWKVLNDAVAPNPEKPWIPGETEAVEYTPYICFIPDTLQGHEFIALLTGTNIETGNVIGLMGQVAFDPDAKHVVIRDEIELRIDDIDLVSPNGQKILYIIRFKK